MGAECLADKIAYKKRIKEIDELRARGEKTELQVWWENTPVKRDKKDYKNWDEDDIAFLVQHRRHLSFKTIAEILDRTTYSCENKYKSLKRQEMLEYYRIYKAKGLVEDYKYVYK